MNDGHAYKVQIGGKHYVTRTAVLGDPVTAREIYEGIPLAGSVTKKRLLVYLDRRSKVLVKEVAK